MKHNIIAAKGKDASILCQAVLVAIALNAKRARAHSFAHFPSISVKDESIRELSICLIAVATQHEDVLAVSAGKEGISPRSDLGDVVGSPSSRAVFLSLMRDALDRVQCIRSHTTKHKGIPLVCAAAVSVSGEVEIRLSRPRLSHGIEYEGLS